MVGDPSGRRRSRDRGPQGKPAGRVCPEILFGKSDDEKVVKNRLHLDLRPSDKESEIERVLSLGAREVDIGQDGHETWTVLADPEGNEFCILRALTEEDLAKS